MPVNHFKVDSFWCFSIKDQIHSRPIQLDGTPDSAGWVRRVLGYKAGLSDEFLPLREGDKSHKELPSQHPLSLSVFSVIYNGWRCCCVTKRIQQAYVCTSACEYSGWVYVHTHLGSFFVHLFITIELHYLQVQLMCLMYLSTSIFGRQKFRKEYEPLLYLAHIIKDRVDLMTSPSLTNQRKLQHLREKQWTESQCASHYYFPFSFLPPPAVESHHFCFSLATCITLI